MFASRSLTIHVLRGIGGFGAFGLAMMLAHWVWPLLILLPAGLLLLRGCPMCWTLGLVETIQNTIRKRSGQPPLFSCDTCRLETANEPSAVYAHPGPQ